VSLQWRWRKATAHTGFSFNRLWIARMNSVIIQIDMTTLRSLLRYPALLGVVLLLFSGVREAYGFGSCPMMHPGGDASAVASEPADHSGHNHPLASADPGLEVPSHSGHSGEEGGRCECRVVCISVPAPTPPEPIVLKFDPVLPPEPSTALVVEDAGLLPTLNRPHLLPFANAPPAFS